MNLPAIWETQVWSLGWEDPLEKGMATHSSILAWRTPWTEEPGGLQFMGSHRVIHNWMTNTHNHWDSHMEQLTSSKLGKEYVKTIYCNPVYLIYMQSTSSEMPGGWSTSWNQDAGRNIYNFRYIDDTTLLASRPQGISRQNSASTSPGAGDPSPGLLPEHSLLVPKHPQQCTVDPEGVSLDVVFVWCFRGEK